MASLVLGGALLGCSASDADGATGVAVGEATESPHCWTADANGALRWDRADGHQLAYSQIGANGKSQLALSIDGAVCNLTAGLDDTSIAFAPGGRRYAFLSLRAGAPDLFAVDMDVGPSARRLGCSAVGPLVDVAPVLLSDGRVLFATKSEGRPASIHVARATADGCVGATKLFELPVAPTRADILTKKTPHTFDGNLDPHVQRAYDDLLASLLDAAVAQRGSELAALTHESLAAIARSPGLEAFAQQAQAGTYFDRLAHALWLAEHTDTVAGMALDPGYPASKKLAVITAATGLTIYDGVDPAAGAAGRAVALHIAPSAVDASSFAPGVSWQGTHIAFAVGDYQHVPRTLVWDGARQLTDEQIVSNVADVAKQWGPLGLRRFAGGLIEDRALAGMEPALGPSGGRGAPGDGERIAFRHMSINDPDCELRQICSGAPRMDHRVHLGNHWDVAQGGDPIRALNAVRAPQGRPVFRP